MTFVRVIFLTKQYALGGGPRAMFYLCKAMPQVEFFVFAEAGGLAEEFMTLSNVHTMTIKKWGFKEAFQIYRFYKKNRIDVVHCHSIIPAIYFIPFFSMKKVITFHGLHIRKYDFSKNSILRFLRKLLKNLLVMSYQLSLVLCKDDELYLRNLLYKPKTLEIIPNAIQKPSVMGNRPCMSFDAQYFNLIMVARYDFQKGYDLLLDMLCVIKEDVPDLRIYFIGNDHVLHLLEGYTDLYNQKVFYLGETSDPYQYIADADYLLLPSRWEGLPMVVLEALSLGTKVIAADTANVNSMSDEKNIYIYHQGDSKDFLRVLKKCQKTKRDRAEYDLSPYTLATVGRRMFELYQQVEE